MFWLKQHSAIITPKNCRKMAGMALQVIISINFRFESLIEYGEVINITV